VNREEDLITKLMTETYGQEPIEDTDSNVVDLYDYFSQKNNEAHDQSNAVHSLEAYGKKSFGKFFDYPSFVRIIVSDNTLDMPKKLSFYTESEFPNILKLSTELSQVLTLLTGFNAEFIAFEGAEVFFFTHIELERKYKKVA